jgi:aryl sulfotransferase
MATKAKAVKPRTKSIIAKSARPKTAKGKAAKVKPKKPNTVKAKSKKAKPAKVIPIGSKSSRAKIAKAKAKPRKPQKTKSSTAKIAWPVKTREMHNHHMNSTVWNNFKFRDDDIVIVTYAKSGTTWMQQIVGQLIFDGDEDTDVARLSPWVDLRIMPPEVIAGLEQQTHRRFIKTHLPVDALVFSPKAKYIFIGRDGRDAAWSLFNHHINATEEYFEAFNNTPGRVGPRLERGSGNVHEFYTGWFDGDGHPYWPVWENIRSWWALRDLPNVKLIHFNDMKVDLPGSVRRIADFLKIKPDAAAFEKILAHCTFDYMKAHAELAAPRGGIMWNGGAKTFINKGTNGRWRDTLSAAEVTAYEAKALKELGPVCAKWLARGSIEK